MEPNDPVDLNNSTADVCFAHFFFFPEKVLPLEEYPHISELQEQPCMRTSRLDVLSEVLHAIFDMSFLRVCPRTAT